MRGANRRHKLLSQVTEQREKLEAANAKVNEKAGRNLFFAILSGLFLACLVLVPLFFFPVVFYIFLYVAAGFALWELATAFRFSGRRVPRIGVIIGGEILLLGATLYAARGLVWGMFIASAVLMLWRLFEGLLPKYEAPLHTMLADLASGIFTLTYIPFLMGMAVLVRQIDNNGQWWLFVAVLLPVTCDIGAYAAGVMFGKHKMAPRVSPNKTWEGFAGAAAAVTLASVLAVTLLLGERWWIGVILGLAVLLTATAGDLTESLVKRDLGVKDMSSIIPGHGGILDRLDSILPSIIPVYTVAVLTGAM